ncbi:MAG: glycoside hydrolase, partial [Verrucomicrobiae bacterium]|nr:glycoside hydrolase [Verrucomicrobiae bacterium]
SVRLVSVMVLFGGSLVTSATEPTFEKVPGVVVDHTPASSGVYIGSPSIAVLPNGEYVASHDHFGPKTAEHKSGLTAVFRSSDRGRTWKKIATIDGQFWSTLFVHRGALYIMGTQWHYGPTVIRRSDDGGQTWTEPKDERSGLLLNDGRFHCAPVPVVEHKGRLWRAMEDITLPGIWGVCFRAFMMSAPADADLLKADSWTCSNRLARGRNWLDGDFVGWLEGNAVVAPDGGIVDVLRCDVKSPDEKAAIVRISGDGRTATFDPARGFGSFPGGAKKFTIRHDPQSKLYWSLTTMVHEKHRGARKPGGIRNTLALACSPDLADWTVRCILLYHPDIVKVGFQYVDWQFDGDDLIAVCRTAYDDGLGGARNNHDANFLTFHRIANFRARTMSDSAPIPAGPPTVTHEAGDCVITGSGFEMGDRQHRVGSREVADLPRWNAFSERVGRRDAIASGERDPTRAHARQTCLAAVVRRRASDAAAPIAPR